MKLERFFETGRERRWSQGEVILHRGDKPATAFMISGGFVKVYSITPEGEENIHIIYKTGEVCPLMWILNAASIDLYYEAMTDVEAKVLPIGMVRDFLENDATAAIEVAQMALTMLRVYRRRVGNLELTKASQRLAGRIMLLAQRFGSETEDGIEITVPLTHRDIASSINLTRETVSREMEKLERAGIVGHSGTTLRVLDAMALYELSGFDPEDDPTVAAVPLCMA